MTTAIRTTYHLIRNELIHGAVAILAVVATMNPLDALSAGTSQNCNYKATGDPVRFIPPPNGTKIRFEDVGLRAGAEQTRREIDYTSRAGAETEMEWAIHLQYALSLVCYRPRPQTELLTISTVNFMPIYGHLIPAKASNST